MRWQGIMSPGRKTHTRGSPMVNATSRRLTVACLVTFLLSLGVVPLVRGDESKPGGATSATAKKNDSITAVSVTDVERIQFLQKNAAAQLQELQERMYRLAEMTRDAEPDDAAKLLMAVRKAREQLIIEQ